MSLLVATILCTSYSQYKTIPVVYLSTWQNEYVWEKLQECKQDSYTLTETISLIKPELDSDDLAVVEKWLLDGCVKHFKLDI